MTSPRIFLSVAEYGAPAWYRMHVPGVALSLRGYQVALDTELPPDAAHQYDIFVFQRHHDPKVLDAVLSLRGAGKKVVAEVDDDFWNIGQDNPCHPVWHGDGARKLHTLEAILRASDLVTTSTEALADILREFNENVVVLPNQLPGSQWRARHEPRKDGVVVVGWAGTPTHHADLEVLDGILQQVLDRHPNVECHFVGMLPQWLGGGPPETGATNAAASRAETAAPPASTPPDRVRHFPARAIEHYPNVLAGFDIGLAPLQDSAFNRAKSDLKFIEYGMVGVPAVLSNVEPYARSVTHGSNGLLADTQRDWLDCLERLIDKPDLRARMADEARAYAQSRTIDRNIHLWEEAYGLV